MGSEMCIRDRSDTIKICYEAWKKNKCKHYSISNKKSYSIIEVARLFDSKIKYLPSRVGERYASALTKMNLSNRLVNEAYSKLDLDFHYLEPIYFNNTNARDGKINLDSIVSIATEEKILKGQGDIINMFFVNAIDGNKGPTGRGMMNGNLVFITLGDESKYKGLEKKYVEAFVVAHEIGHNLGLKHALDDPYVNDSLPNIQGEGNFEDRIDPKFSLNHYQMEQIKKSPLFHSRINFLSTIKKKKSK